MRYADGPTVRVDLLIDAPIERVWALVSDVGVPALFSAELQEGRWLDDDAQPAAGRASSAATTTRRRASGRRRAS